MELFSLLLLLCPTVAEANFGQLLDGLQLLGNLFGQGQGAPPAPRPPLPLGPGLLALQPNAAPPPSPSSGLTQLASQGISQLLGSAQVQSSVGELFGALSPQPPVAPPRVGNLRQRPVREGGGGLLESLKRVQPAQVVQIQSRPEAAGAGAGLLELLSPSAQGDLQTKIFETAGRTSGLSVPKLTDLSLFDENFGIKKQKGCIPFFSEVVRLLWADCQTKADSLTWNTWGRQIQNALKGGSIDILAAAQETCRLQADRGSCQQLSERVQSCDILGSLQTLTDIQNAKQRCQDLTAYSAIPQGANAPSEFLSQVVSSVGTELAGGFLRTLLG